MGAVLDGIADVCIIRIRFYLKLHSRFATSRTGHDNILKWNSSEDMAANCVTL